MMDRRPEVMARFLAEVTPLGRALALPCVIGALAQDRACEKLMPYVYTPDFLENSERLVSAWHQHRGELAPEQRALVDVVREQFAASEWLPDRLQLRMEAMRKLDATLTGSEVFGRHSALAGQPYVIERSRDLKVAVKVGSVQQATYGEITPAIAHILCSSRAVSFVEQSLLPFVPAEGDCTVAVWDQHMRMWRETREIRAFEGSSKLQLLPYRTTSPILFAAGAVPAGYRQRITNDQLKPVGVTIEQMVRIGISPYIAEPIAVFLERNPELLADGSTAVSGIEHLVSVLKAHRQLDATTSVVNYRANKIAPSCRSTVAARG